MPSSPERAEFITHLGMLCAGFNVPLTEDRIAAYWSGLTKMNLLAFVRIVEHALGPDGPEKFPNISQVWVIYRQLRKRAKAPAPTEEPGPVLDHFACFANRVLMVFLRKKGPTSDETLPVLVAEKNRITANFRLIAQEETVTAKEFRTQLFKAFSRVHVDISFDQVEAHRAQTCRERSLRFIPRPRPASEAHP